MEMDSFVEKSNTTREKKSNMKEKWSRAIFQSDKQVEKMWEKKMEKMRNDFEDDLYTLQQQRGEFCDLSVERSR